MSGDNIPHHEADRVAVHEGAVVADPDLSFRCTSDLWRNGRKSMDVRTYPLTLLFHQGGISEAGPWAGAWQARLSTTMSLGRRRAAHGQRGADLPSCIVETSNHGIDIGQHLRTGRRSLELGCRQSRFTNIVRVSHGPERGGSHKEYPTWIFGRPSAFQQPKKCPNGRDRTPGHEYGCLPIDRERRTR